MRLTDFDSSLTKPLWLSLTILDPWLGLLMFTINDSCNSETVSALALTSKKTALTFSVKITVPPDNVAVLVD